MAVFFFIPLSEPDKILVYDMKRFDFKIVSVGDRGIKYNAICIRGNSIWLSGNQQVLVRWDILSNEVTYIENFPDGFACREVGWSEVFSQCIVWNDQIYFFPLSGNRIIRINKMDEAETVLTMEENQFIVDALILSKEELYFHIESTDPAEYGQSIILTGDRMTPDAYVENEEMGKVLDQRR